MIFSVIRCNFVLVQIIRCNFVLLIKLTFQLKKIIKKKKVVCLGLELNYEAITGTIAKKAPKT